MNLYGLPLWTDWYFFNTNSRYLNNTNSCILKLLQVVDFCLKWQFLFALLDRFVFFYYHFFSLADLFSSIDRFVFFFIISSDDLFFNSRSFFFNRRIQYFFITTFADLFNLLLASHITYPKILSHSIYVVSM